MYRMLLRSVYRSTVAKRKDLWVRRFGYLLRLNPRDEGITPQVLVGRYEREEVAVIESRVFPGMVVVDVGANIGYMSLALASRVGKNGRVFSFEPDPINRAFLEASIRQNSLADRVKVFDCALGEHEGELHLYQDTVNFGNTSAFKENVVDLGEAVRVPVRRLDALVDVDVDFIKMDVQGAEGAVLRGSQALLEKCRPTILFEFWPIGLQRAGEHPQAILEFLESLGYEITTVDGRACTNEEILAQCTGASGTSSYVNLIAQPAGFEHQASSR